MSRIINTEEFNVEVENASETTVVDFLQHGVVHVKC